MCDTKENFVFIKHKNVLYDAKHLVYTTQNMHSASPGRRELWYYLGRITHSGREKWPPFSRRYFQIYFLNENVWVLTKILQKLVSKSQINNIPALVQIMAWRRPLSEPMMVSLLILARPQWVKQVLGSYLPSQCQTWCKCKYLSPNKFSISRVNKKLFKTKVISR